MIKDLTGMKFGRLTAVSYENFGKFKEWALSNGYKEHLTIDRIDSNKDYCPANCQWITGSENTRKADLERWHNFKRRK